jgi:4-oxalocrotonate tautomerase
LSPEEFIVPVITIPIGEGRSVETKRVAAQAFTAATLGIKPEWVSIHFDEYGRENWATAGELHIDKFGPDCGQAGVDGKS